MRQRKLRSASPLLFHPAPHAIDGTRPLFLSFCRPRQRQAGRLCSRSMRRRKQSGDSSPFFPFFLLVAENSTFPSLSRLLAGGAAPCFLQKVFELTQQPRVSPSSTRPCYPLCRNGKDVHSCTLCCRELFKPSPPPFHSVSRSTTRDFFFLLLPRSYRTMRPAPMAAFLPSAEFHGSCSSMCFSFFSYSKWMIDPNPAPLPGPMSCWRSLLSSASALAGAIQ